MCMTHPLNIPYMEENEIRKVKVDHLTTLPVWLDPSVWSEIWERKHLTPVLDCVALYILSKFNPK